MDNLNEFYYSIEPVERLKLFKEVYTLIENDTEILEDEDALDSYTELTISLQSSITQINNIKEKMLEVIEENKFLREQTKIALDRDNGFNSEIESIRREYEETIFNMREQFREEKAKLIKEQINTPLANKYVEEKLEISNEVNNFVKLRIDDFRVYLEDLSRTDLVKIYEEMLSSQDLKVKILSRNILDFIKSGAKKLTQTIEKKIMLEIERALVNESREVLDDDYR